MFDDQRRHVADGRALGRLRVLEQCARGADRQFHRLRTEAGEIARAEVLGQHSRRRLHVEVPVGQAAGRDAGLLESRDGSGVRDQDLRGAEAGQFRGQCGERGVHRLQAARGERQPGEAGAALHRDDGEEDVVAAIVEEGGVGERPGRHDARDLALDRPLRRRGVADLLADGH